MEVKLDQENIKKMKSNYRNQKKKVRIIITLVLVLILIVLIGIIFFKARNKNNSSNLNAEEPRVVPTLVGKWTTDGNTIYAFNEDGRGVLIVPVTNLPFTYKFENNRLFIDFENEDSEDTYYTYEVTENKLTLKNINGIFEFSRAED